MTQQSAAAAASPRLPRLTRNEALARSAIARSARDLPAPIGGAAWLLSLTPLPSDAARGFGEDDWLVRGSWAGARFELRLPPAACEAWVRARFPALDLPALPPEMRAAALEDALAQALAALNAMQRGPARIEGVAAPAQAEGLPHAFGLELSCEGQVAYGALAVDGLGLMLVAGALAQRPPAAGPLDEDAAPILLRAEIGAATLSLQLLRSLRTGDAIFIERPYLTPDGQLRLAAGDWAVTVRQQGTGLEVIQPLQKVDLQMATDNDNAGAEAGSLDGLPVRLQFDLGERSITLGELKALQPGQVLELARPLSQAVSIRANGAVVGTGELVEVDGRLAVSVSAIAVRPE